jgi:DDE superfamily endonuclease
MRGRQRVRREGVGDAEQRVWHFHPLGADAMGEPDGMRMCDETGGGKNGPDAVGGARQSWGPLGQGAHGQVGGCAASAWRRGYARVDQRLFLPEAGCTDTSAPRRTQCQGPPERTLQRHPPLAAAMLPACAPEGLLPCQEVMADCRSGPRPDCLEAVDAWGGVTTCVAMPADTRCWLQAPRTAEHVSRSQGAGRSKRVVAPDPAPGPVAAVAARRPAARWSRRQVSEGPQGPSVSACARQRVTRCQDGLPERTVWLVRHRTMGAEPLFSASISHAPASTPFRPFVWRSGLRGALEPGVEAGQTALGRDHYDGRTYPGWHHHMLPTMWAHVLLWHLKLPLGETRPRPHCVATTDVLGGAPPSLDVHD